jgi:hypothetical protein
LIKKREDEERKRKEDAEREALLKRQKGNNTIQY